MVHIHLEVKARKRWIELQFGYNSIGDGMPERLNVMADFME